MKNNLKKGFTLIELVIVLAIVTIILGVLTTVFVSSSNIFTKVDMNSELQLEAQMFESSFSKIALESAGINYDKTIITSDGMGNQMVNRLYLKDSIDTTNNHVYLFNDNKITYKKISIDALGNEVILSERTICNNVKSFTITPILDPVIPTKYIKYTVIYEITKGGKVQEVKIKNQIVFRNFN